MFNINFYFFLNNYYLLWNDVCFYFLENKKRLYFYKGCGLCVVILFNNLSYKDILNLNCILLK